MRRALVILVFCSTAFASSVPCVILRRASAGDHNWSGIEFYYVSGAFPDGYKFRTNFRGRHIRELVKMGGKMSILEPGYTAEQLEKAQEQCALFSGDAGKERAHQ